VPFDKLDTAKMHGLDTSNVSCRGVTSQVEFGLNACVAEAPSAFARGLEDVQLEDLGLEATFDCEVSKPDLTAEWFKGDKPIKRSEKYNITSKNGTHTLTINDCQVDDVASYSIKLDGISSTAKLAIKGNGRRICARFNRSYHFSVWRVVTLFNAFLYFFDPTSI